MTAYTGTLRRARFRPTLGRAPVAAGWIVALALALIMVTPTPAPADGPTIQPGVSIGIGDSYCTLGWIVDRVEEDADGELDISVYGITAGHCVDEVGQQATVYESPSDATGQRMGEVAFIGDPDEDGRDYAFIEIDAANVDQVDPAVAGHPKIPSGLSEQPQEGDLIQFSGHAIGFDQTATTREERVGVLNWFNEQEHQVTGPVSLGDSGGPVANLSEGDTAFGIVNTIGVGAAYPSLTVVQAGEGGANLAFVLDDAAESGLPTELCVVGEPCGTR